MNYTYSMSMYVSAVLWFDWSSTWLISDLIYRMVKMLEKNAFFLQLPIK